MAHKKIQLCINADDFGFAPEISKGILFLMEKGLLSSTSIMPMHCEKEEWKNISKQKDVSVGLHFSLTSGCNQLVENCKNQYSLARKVLSGKIKKADVYKELAFQYETLAGNFSGEITHIDTHQHIHILPAVAEAMKKLSAEKKISYVRLTKEISPGISIKKTLFNFSAGKNNQRVPVFGLNMMGKRFTKKNILSHFKFLKNKNIGKALWIVHPGYKSPVETFSDSYNIEREHEMKLFIEMQNEIREFADIVPLTALL